MLIKRTLVLTGFKDLMNNAAPDNMPNVIQTKDNLNNGLFITIINYNPPIHPMGVDYIKIIIYGPSYVSNTWFF
jgi:hypothetical protein